MAIKNKDLQIIAYLSKKHPKASVTVLMKLCYLIDLINVKREKKQITSFEYRRYNYGPFDDNIYPCLEELATKKIIEAKTDYTQGGNEFIVYCFNEESGFKFDEISEKEFSIIDELLESVNGYGAKVLTEIAYKTKPMQALGATIDGGENLNAKLDLSL
jgi:uncharacterized phage-associated protein